MSVSQPLRNACPARASSAAHVQVVVELAVLDRDDAAVLGRDGLVAVRATSTMLSRRTPSATPSAA